MNSDLVKIRKINKNFAQTLSDFKGDKPYIIWWSKYHPYGIEFPALEECDVDDLPCEQVYTNSNVYTNFNDIGKTMVVFLDLDESWVAFSRYGRTLYRRNQDEHK